MRRVVISTGTYPGVTFAQHILHPAAQTRRFFAPLFRQTMALAINTEFSPDELSRPPARYDLIIGPGDRSLSKSGDAETVAQKICPDVGAYVRCADRELRSVALVFLFLGGR